MRGGVHRWSPDGVEQVVPKRRGVGGIVLHEDGGLVVTGRDVMHVRDGETRVLLDVDGVTGFNDLGTAPDGSVYVGSLRFMPFRGEAPVPGEIWRIPAQGDAAPVAGGVLWANGIGFSPDGPIAYGSDYARSCVLAWDVAADGSLTLAAHVRGDAGGLGRRPGSGQRGWGMGGDRGGGERGALHGGRVARPQARRPGVLRLEPLLRRRGHARPLRHDRATASSSAARSDVAGLPLTPARV